MARDSSNLKPLTLSSAPRPLQLQSQPLPSNPQSLLSRSNSTGGRFAGTQEPRSPASHSPPSTNNGAGKRPMPKRLSSISYSTSNSAAGPSSTPLRSAPLNRPSRPTSLYIERAPALDFSPPCATAGPTSGPPTVSVLTLAEKHADLLRFIAAKESKCLELRTQLEQHESELLVLKRKWERIVSKTKVKEHGSSAAGAQKDMPVGVSGDVVEALKGVGRYLGLAEESGLSTRNSAAPNSPSSATTSSFSPVFPTLPSLADAPNHDTQSTYNNTPKTDAWKLSHHKRQVASRSSSPPSSVPSPTSSSMPSARDSLSSISTASSSLDLPISPASQGDLTPTDKLDDSMASWDPMAKDPGFNGGTLPWMPAIPVPVGLNKKWEQIQRNSTFEKHSKRASLLLSDVTDMSSSILGSLSSVLLSPAPSSTVQSRKPSAATSSPRPLSLLDEDEEGAGHASLSKPILPSGGSPAARPQPIPAKATVTPDDASEEWNW